jgi:hypothetical protein
VQSRKIDVPFDLIGGCGYGDSDAKSRTQSATQNFTAARMMLGPNAGLLALASGLVDDYTGISGPTSFGSGGTTFASSSGGNAVAILGGGGIAEVFVPQGYVSGTSLSDTSTYAGATLLSLGITPGIYTWTWGTGVHADSFTINAGVGVPDAGSTLPLLGFASLGLVALRRKLGC